MLVLPSKSSWARLAPKMPQGSHRGAPGDLQAATREPLRCSMGPPGSPKGVAEVPDGTSRQPQGSHRGAPWDFHAAPREPQGFPIGPQGIPKGATEVPHGTSRQPQGSHGELHVVFLGVHIWVSDPRSPSPELRKRASDHEEPQIVSLGV